MPSAIQDGSVTAPCRKAPSPAMLIDVSAESPEALAAEIATATAVLREEGATDIDFADGDAEQLLDEVGVVHADRVVVGQQRADLDRRGVAGLQVAEQVLQRQAGVDDVLDDQDVASVDRGVEVLEDPHDPRGIGRRPVAGDRHQVDLT